jgi:hypothetical protein
MKLLILSSFLEKVCSEFGIVDYYLYLCNVRLEILFAQLGNILITNLQAAET